ncbi:hypothetical protein A1OQ_21175 [Enterovibrio norvegicus FF-162]|nr:hypothetical protein A1OQ_21175 [Enterovibrio norvegicus FF-162]
MWVSFDIDQSQNTVNAGCTVTTTAMGRLVKRHFARRGKHDIMPCGRVKVLIRIPFGCLRCMEAGMLRLTACARAHDESDIIF